MSSSFSEDETAPFLASSALCRTHLLLSRVLIGYLGILRHGLRRAAKSGVGVASMGVMRLELAMKSIVLVVMVGVLGIYGLIVAVISSTRINPKVKSYYLFDGYAHLSSGLACGLI
ncbi:hypothetical protein FNV43_RR24794 [Rhamnella rubrinervis]|uniref:V-type proton ATPase proteolipid subunit n=1 Tax=Rhamnella rubrinervis TaxID=2594499 RepID=A0A8K0GQK0_9ROSA|nr:hypothetical protein FNV43_RR24794 [Rhamnella rubrinervis]